MTRKYQFKRIGKGWYKNTIGLFNLNLMEKLTGGLELSIRRGDDESDPNYLDAVENFDKKSDAVKFCKRNLV